MHTRPRRHAPRLLTARPTYRPTDQEALEDIVRRTKSGRKLTDEGVWGNIGRSMVVVYDELAENARGMQNGHTPAIVKQLNMIMTRMEIM